MSDSFDFDDFEQQNTGEPDWLRKLRKEHRDFTRQNKELTEQLQGLRKEQRGATVKSVLEAAGVNPKVAGFVPADIEPTKEAISGWLQEYGDIFGATAPKTAEPQEAPASSAPTTPAVPDDVVAQLQRIQGADTAASAVNQDANTQAASALQSLGANVQSSQDFFKALQGLR